ncbi:DUF6220 domain-containing protein [Cellulosimicrobium marinum]|uniref:DUF6220 domain-containing protein n=1 Tax=Cellulosimicrobium marinum TaxID=1638992 RepID=UPI001E59A1B7|nr:DUF6220 domain-containing protein [Cellulosimicrobium marinum]
MSPGTTHLPEAAMRKVYVALTVLLLAAVVTQFYLAAYGVFTVPDTDDAFVLHQSNGRMVIPLLTVLATFAAAVARAGARTVWLTLLPLGLLVVQVLLFVLAGATGSSPERTTVAGRALLGLHAVNGLAILWTCVVLVRRALRLARTGSAVAPVPEPRPLTPAG